MFKVSSVKYQVLSVTRYGLRVNPLQIIQRYALCAMLFAGI